MGIKKYILFSVVYLLGVGLYVYSFNGQSYTLEVYKFSLSLPIALWIVVPVIILFIGTLLHMMFYSFREYLFARALKKDFETYKTALSKKILSEEPLVRYKTEKFKFIGKSLKLFDYNGHKMTLDETLEPLMDIVAQIQEGKVVDLKRYKLDQDNPLVVKNKMNKLDEDPKFASTVLKECKDPSTPLCHKAYFKFLGYAGFDEIQKVGFTPTKEMFRVLMERYLDEEEEFDIPLESIEEMLMQFKATREDYLELAYEIKPKLSPDAWMDMFEKLYNSPKHAEAADAYLYVLYELQMIDKIRDILDNSDEDEFVKFKTLLFLRDHGKNIDSGIFLRFT